MIAPFPAAWPVAILPLLIALAACAPSDANIYGGLRGQRVVGNEISVSVTNMWNQTDALPLADQHCRGYGRAARFSGIRELRLPQDKLDAVQAIAIASGDLTYVMLHVTGDRPSVTP